MYAVVSTGGKQYRVEAGTTLSVELLAVEPGETVTFDRVLLVGDGEDLRVGTPTVAGATVSGTVLANELGPKLIIFKFKNKARYRRRTGHRQHLTRVRIDAIDADGTGRDGSGAAAKPTRRRTARKPAASEPETASEAAPETEAATAATRAKPARPKRASASAASEAPKRPRRRAAPKKTDAEE